MLVKNMMTTTVVSVEMDDPLKVVKNIFDNTHFHHLLVTESDKLLGIISDRDLLKALSPNIGTAAETNKDVATLNKKAHQIMTRHPLTITPEAGIYDAIDIFNTHSISCIPVVDSQHKPIGLISWRDIFKAIGENRRHASAKDANKP